MKNKWRFVRSWYNKRSWLEYSIAVDAVFCLPCYLFRSDCDSIIHFVDEGFKQWNKKDRLDVHVGPFDSPHSIAVRKCSDLMNQNQSIGTFLSKQTVQMKSDYYIRLKASLEVVKMLLRGGMSFRGHDESIDSSYRGHFLEFLEVLRKNNSDFARCVLGNAPKNSQMTSPDIQKDLSYACASETISKIIRDIGDDVFAVLVDESSDCAGKEQMAVVLRFVDDRGFVIERFIGIVHVTATTSLFLKKALVSLLTYHGLSLSRIRGQGYDGASNMQGRFGGLKTLIQNENPYAYYVHCFAHQLQLALVAVVRGHPLVNGFVDLVTSLVNVIKASNLRQDCLRMKQAEHLEKALEEGEIETGRGLNQESTLIRAGDTRWGSHYKTFVSLKKLYFPVLEVLEVWSVDGSFIKSGTADGLLARMQTFEFVFMLHLMTSVLAVSYNLSQALQMHDQDLLNAMRLVHITKQRLQDMRNDGWEVLFNEVVLFCNKHHIDVPSMDENRCMGIKSRLQASFTNLHHFKVDCFNSVIDLQISELNNRFAGETVELLNCISCLHPASSFEAFDIKSLMRLSEFYPDDFANVDSLTLANELQNYIMDVRTDNRLDGLKGLTDLSKKLVQTKKHKIYPFVYMLVKLSLILPVATASDQRRPCLTNQTANVHPNNPWRPWIKG